MWNRRNWFATLLLSALLLTLLSVPVFGIGESKGTGDTEGMGESDATFDNPALTLLIGNNRHEPYINGYVDGTFHPDEYVTRAEAAQMLYSQLAEIPSDRVMISDVPYSAWYYDALSLFAAYSIIDSADGYTVGPNAPLTRAQFVQMLSCFFPEEEDAVCSFSDVPSWVSWYSDVAKATSKGWIRGYGDGTFRPGAYITRAESTAVLNRALGRSPDTATIHTETVIPVYSDLSAKHWAYYEIMEATIGHRVQEGHTSSSSPEIWVQTDTERLRYPEGLVFVGNELYCAGADGKAFTDNVVNGLYFGPDGRYTCGDDKLDNYVKYVLSEITVPGMSQEEKLHAAFNYTRDSFSYLRRHYYEIGDTGWTAEEGKTMFETGRGNCYCYTSVFYYLARQLGYNATAISGVVGSNRSPHAWVEIDFDEVTYIFDTELEMAWRARGYNFDFYMMSYDSVPWSYEK